MMQNRALSVAPYVAVMPFTLGGAKLCQAAEVGLPPYLADRGAGIPTPLLGMPRANHCLHGRMEPETCARTGADRRTDFAAKRIEIVRTEHDCGSFHRFSFHAEKEICARLSKKCETKKGGRGSRDAGSRLTSRTLPRWPSPLAGRNSAKRPKRY